jgi:ABC-type branched-chain amino acid transport systems, ATPase component
MQSDKNILQIDNLSKYFGGLAAVADCSLKIKKGTITGIIGPNRIWKNYIIQFNCWKFETR